MFYIIFGLLFFSHKPHDYLYSFIGHAQVYREQYKESPNLSRQYGVALNSSHLQNVDIGLHQNL